MELALSNNLRIEQHPTQQVERSSKVLYKTEGVYRQKWGRTRKLLKEKKGLLQRPCLRGKSRGSHHADYPGRADQKNSRLMGLKFRFWERLKLQLSLGLLAWGQGLHVWPAVSFFFFFLNKRKHSFLCIISGWLIE